ncbi:hypothetical protein LINGRAHAP2_LOCUS16834 [Linum grandiflorum]
MTMM